MRHFGNILVGVDIAQLENPESAKFSPPVEEAIRQGIWLAGKTSSSLTFIAVLDASEHSLENLGPREQQRVIADDGTFGNRRVGSTRQPGASAQVNAARTLRFGKGWVEIIREVLAERHDLTIVGTRDLRVVKRLLLGSTAMKLLAEVSEYSLGDQAGRQLEGGIRNIAVASDFSPVSAPRSPRRWRPGCRRW